jgi:hypothetical protein
MRELNTVEVEEVSGGIVGTPQAIPDVGDVVICLLPEADVGTGMGPGP